MIGSVRPHAADLNGPLPRVEERQVLGASVPRSSLIQVTSSHSGTKGENCREALIHEPTSVAFLGEHPLNSLRRYRCWSAIADHLRSEHARNPRLEVQLLNVQIPADYSGHARMLVSQDELDSYYGDEAAEALKPMRAALDAAGVPYTVRQEVGHVAPTILRCASEFGADRIVMGRRGLSDLVDRVLGSVASDVSAQAHVPVMLLQ